MLFKLKGFSDMQGPKSSTWIVVLGLMLFSVIDVCSGDQATAIFAFGDSYADTGNFFPSSNSGIVSPWKYPYGITWPGNPDGRVSSGRLQTDYIAQILDLPSPVPHRLLNDSEKNTTSSKGINFAESASGVFESFGRPKLSVQVERFKAIIGNLNYDTAHLNRSVVLLSINGNDYSYKNVTLIFNGSREFAKEVVTEMKLQLTELYKVGLRNFLVSNTLPFDCEPGLLQSGAVCLNTTKDLVSAHNEFLSEVVSELRKLEGANFLVLDLFKAFYNIVSQTSAYGIQEIKRSCCSSPGLNLTTSFVGCGDYDKDGKPLFELCKNPETHFFFDWAHPTQKGWETVMNLHYSQSGFVQDGTSTPKSLEEWLSRLGFNSSSP